MKGEATMNEGKLQSLGRRARRCSRWRWLPGMQVIRPALGGAGATMITPTHYRLVEGVGYPAPHEWALIDIERISADTMLIPDLRDPATLGWLLALVRDAWPKAPAPTSRFTYYSPERGSYSAWACTYWRPDADSPHGGAWIQAHGDTEAEALVAALEAAGTQEGE